MNFDQIKEIENLIQLEPGRKIKNHKVKRLTAAGDNYGSLMLSVDVTIGSPEGFEEIHTVAKVPPPNHFIQEMFNTPITFRNEICFYKEIVPTLQDFQRENGIQEVIDFAPKYYGSRFNLKSTDEIDSDAVLLLENLKIENYVNLNRVEGFDEDTAKLILTDFAHLHAVSLALKLKKPEIFEAKVKPYLRRLTMSQLFYKSMEKKMLTVLDSTVEIRPYLDKIKKFSFDEMFPEDMPREPFATICHNDGWVNNTMQLLDRNNKPIKNKLVDFQICDFGSPAKDVLFFLFSSVRQEVLEKKFDGLVDFYHGKFVTILKKLKVDTSRFSRGAFEEEMNYEAPKSQFCHILLMLFPIFAPEGTVADLSELHPEDIGTTEPTESHKKRLIFVVEEFVKRNWI